MKNCTKELVTLDAWLRELDEGLEYVQAWTKACGGPVDVAVATHRTRLGTARHQLASLGLLSTEVLKVAGVVTQPPA